MEQMNTAVCEPPSLLVKVTTSFPATAFGRSTSRYYSFLEALLSGLLEYEAQKRGKADGSSPLPAA